MAKPKIVRLSQNAMIAILDFFGKRKIVGANFKEFDLPAEKLEEIISQGRDELEEEDLLRDRGSKNLFIEPAVGELVRALFNQQAAIVVIIKSKGHGQYSLSLNAYKDLIVEHFIDETDYHVLTGFTDYASVFARITEIIPLKAVSDANRPRLAVATSFVENLVQLSKQPGAQNKIADELKKKEYSDEIIKSLSQALSSPLLSISGAFLLIEGDEATEASSFSIFADENASWGIWPKAENGSLGDLWLMPSGINDVQMCVSDWLGARE